MKLTGSQRCSYVNRGTHFAVALLGSVALPIPSNDNADAAPTPQLKWINVANEGQYLGHHQGGFKLDATVMQQLVDNLHQHPQYELGDIELDGKAAKGGVNDVVQFDYEHASEMAPWEGTIPVNGAPAIGWVRDLELRKDGQGRLQLWALAWLGEQIRGQIDRREYKWVSIAWNPAGVHWQSGKPIGAVLTSIAFTNHPFLQDLESIAAASRMAGQPSRSGVQPKAPSAEAHAPTGSTSRSRERAPMELRTRLCTLYSLQSEANDDSIIRAAENAATVGGNLAALLQALGVQNAEAALAAVPELTAARQRLVDALAELDGLATADATADQTVAQTDVAAALSARGLVRNGFADPNLISALSAQRAATIAAEIGKLPKRELTVGGKKITAEPSVGDQRLARERGRQAFLASYGVNTNPATQHLSQTFVAGPGAAGPGVQYPAPGAALPVQLSNPALPMPADARPPLQLPNGGAQPVVQQPINLSAYGGRNTTERVISYLASQDASFDKLSWGEKVTRAAAWRRQYESQHGALAAA